MIADYYSKGFDKEHVYGETIDVVPKILLFIPVKGNLRAIIESKERIRISKYCPYANPSKYPDVNKLDRAPPSLFWDEYLVSSENKRYVFETNYCTDSDDILPISHVDQIPAPLKREFLRVVPRGIHDLANNLIGNEIESRTILQKFNNFVYEHEKPENETTGKPIEQLLDEYERTGDFYGNCKEASTFFMGLCDAAEYPTKRVIGKSPHALEGHVWVDVFVPVENSYKLFPVDAALDLFGNHNPEFHILFEESPTAPNCNEPSLLLASLASLNTIEDSPRKANGIKDFSLRKFIDWVRFNKIRYKSKFIDWVKGEVPKKYNLKIERID